MAGVIILWTHLMKEGRGERTELERRDRREREEGDKEMRGEIFGL